VATPESSAPAPNGRAAVVRQDLDNLLRPEIDRIVIVLDKAIAEMGSLLGAS
jgi:hypothetical protein